MSFITLARSNRWDVPEHIKLGVRQHATHNCRAAMLYIGSLVVNENPWLHDGTHVQVGAGKDAGRVRLVKGGPRKQMTSQQHRKSLNISVPYLALGLDLEPGLYPCQFEAEGEEITITLPRSFWTEERVAELERGIADRLTASQIAESLGTTKNAVIGKAHRLGLAWDLSPSEVSMRARNAARCNPHRTRWLKGMGMMR